MPWVSEGQTVGEASEGPLRDLRDRDGGSVHAAEVEGRTAGTRAGLPFEEGCAATDLPRRSVLG